MKPRLCVALALASLAAAPLSARADDKAACLDAASKGQRLRGTHQLVEAREQLRICAAAVCPGVVQHDCAEWLAEVESALPSVVVTAKDGAGVDLVDVTVTVDGQAFLAKLDGQSVPMNAGPRDFHFETADGATLEERVVVREGEKNQRVAVVIGAPPVAAPPPPPPPPPPVVPAPSSTPRTVGWVLAGAGVVGLGVGAVAGGVALGNKGGAHCVNDVCDPGSVNGIKTAAIAADVGLVAGGVLLAGGVALVLVSSGRAHDRATRLELTPTVAAGGGGAMLRGSW